MPPHLVPENTLEILPFDRENNRSAANLTRTDGTNFYLYFEADEPENIRNDNLADPFIIASALFFMRSGGEVRVIGSCSRRILVGMEEWCGAFVNMFPHLYKRTRFVPETISPHGQLYPPNNKSVAAFSGGVDAFFTLLRHHEGSLGGAGTEITDALLVHGFDVEIDDEQGFSEARAAAEKGLAPRGIPLRIIRSNFRKMPGQSWAHAHGSGLAAALSLVGTEGTVGLIGSSYTYKLPHTGWGSAPELDHLLSNSNLEIRHDGADFTRHQKVRFLIQFPQEMALLRVCFQQSAKGRNCGRCEKCWRTRYSFAIEGIDEPPCFPNTPLENLAIGKLNHTSELFWIDLREVAVRKHRTALVKNIDAALEHAR